MIAAYIVVLVFVVPTIACLATMAWDVFEEKAPPPQQLTRWHQLVQPRALPSEQQRLDEIKEAYLRGLVTVDRMEEDVQFVLEGGYFAGSYERLIKGGDEHGSQG